MLVGLVALALLAAWFGRDVPRRWVEQRLAATLAADVRLARFEIENRHHFVLHGLEVRRPDWEPRLDSLAIERLDVESPLRDILKARFDSLTLDGVDVRLEPSFEPAAPAPESELTVRRIEIRRGRLAANAGTEAARLEFSGALKDWGNEPTGDFRIDATRLDLAPWRDIFSSPVEEADRAALPATGTLQASIVGLHLEARVRQRPATLRLETDADRIQARYGERAFELRGARVEANVVHEPASGRVRVAAQAVVPGIEAARLEAGMAAETLTLQNGHAELDGLELATLLEAAGILPDGWTLEGTARVDVRTADGQAFEWHLHTDLARVDVALGETPFHGRQVRADARGTWLRSRAGAAPPLLTFESDATLATLAVASGTAELTAIRPRITLSGRLEEAGGGPLSARWDLPAGHGRVGATTLPAELFPLGGTLDGRFALAEGAGFTGRTDLASPALGELRVDGHTGFDQAALGADWDWQWSHAPDLAILRRTAEKLGVTLPSSLRVEGRAQAAGTVEGALADPDLRGRLSVDGLGLFADVDTGTREAGTWRFDEGAGVMDLERRAGEGSRVSVAKLGLKGSLLHEPSSGTPEDLVPWARPLTLTASGLTDLLQGQVQVDDASIDLQDLGRLLIDGQLESDSRVTATVAIEAADLRRLRELSHLWVEDPAPESTLGGSLACRIELQRTPGGLWQAHGELELSGAGFSSADGARVAEGAAGHWDLGLTAPSEGGIELEGTGELTGPVMLWGTLFGDFSALTSRLELTAQRRGDRWESTLEWELPRNVHVNARIAASREPPGESLAASGPTVDATGTHEPGGDEAPRVEYAVTADVPDLTAFLESFVRGPFQGSVERIDTLTAAGSLRVDLHGALDAAHSSMDGTVVARGASFSGAGETGIGGLDLTLPIALEWTGEPGAPFHLVPGNEVAGSLSYERLVLGGVEVPPLETRLSVSSDTLWLDRPVRLAVLDGNLELRQVALAEWSRSSRHLRFGLGMEDLSLAALTRELQTVPLDGTLSGLFPAVRLTPSRLQVDGGGTIEIFGGATEIYDISGQDLLSRFPRVTFSAHLRDIHLLDVTRTFDFGEVDGVVRGEILECELFRSVPVRCEAELRTVQTKGVPRKISVKAIHNISILGSGERVGFLDRGLQRFLDTYTYEAIGVTMSLRNDRFLLRGTERRGRRELFIKGRLPFRIDIVNVAPGQAVSFQTMLNRLQNLEVVAGPPRRDQPDRR